MKTNVPYKLDSLDLIGYNPSNSSTSFQHPRDIAVLPAHIYNPLPAVISIKKWNLESKAIKEMSLFEKMVDHLGKVVLTHPKYVFSAGTILVVFGLFGFHKISIDVNFANFFKPESEIRDSMDFMDQEMTGTLDLRVRIEGDMRDPHVLNDVSSLQI